MMSKQATTPSQIASQAADFEPARRQLQTADLGTGAILAPACASRVVLASACLAGAGVTCSLALPVRRRPGTCAE